jgi:hypothetical protein
VAGIVGRVGEGQKKTRQNQQGLSQNVRMRLYNLHTISARVLDGAARLFSVLWSPGPRQSRCYKVGLVTTGDGNR